MIDLIVTIVGRTCGIHAAIPVAVLLLAFFGERGCREVGK